MYKEKLKRLENLYNILDLMENDIISSYYKETLKNNIKELLKELLGGIE